MNKVDLIRSQIGMDWSKVFLRTATAYLLMQPVLPFRAS